MFLFATGFVVNSIYEGPVSHVFIPWRIKNRLLNAIKNNNQEEIDRELLKIHQMCWSRPDQITSILSLALEQSVETNNQKTISSILSFIKNNMESWDRRSLLEKSLGKSIEVGNQESLSSILSFVRDNLNFWDRKALLEKALEQSIEANNQEAVSFVVSVLSVSVDPWDRQELFEKVLEKSKKTNNKEAISLLSDVVNKGKEQNSYYAMARYLLS